MIIKLMSTHPTRVSCELPEEGVHREINEPITYIFYLLQCSFFAFGNRLAFFQLVRLKINEEKKEQRIKYCVNRCLKVVPIAIRLH